MPSRPRSGLAPGKIILSGEYAVVFGHGGVAVPAQQCLHVAYHEDLKRPDLHYTWQGVAANQTWYDYLEQIITLCQDPPQLFCGQLNIDNQLPLGKGMGSSTSLVIATARALLGEDCRGAALAIEDAVNRGHSGLDFNVIWANQPMFFASDQTIEPIDLPPDLLDQADLIDAGTPEQTTPELVAWVQSKVAEQDRCTLQALTTIGECSTRLKNLTSNNLEALAPIIKDHHQAQVALGVVPKKTQALIAQIEAEGGFAKVIGAGSRTGGGGMVLAWGN